MEYNPELEGYPIPQQRKEPDDIMAAQMQDERVRNFVAQISPEHQLMDLQWRIKGYIRDPMSGEWKKVTEGAAEPSPVLVSRYISYLSSLLNQNTTFSNLSSTEINGIMRLIIEWIVDDLEANAEEYGLEKEYQERTRIGHIMLNNTFMVMKRSQNGMESKRIFGTMNMNENMGQQPNQKGGFLETLKFWK